MGRTGPGGTAWTQGPRSARNCGGSGGRSSHSASTDHNRLVAGSATTRGTTMHMTTGIARYMRMTRRPTSPPIPTRSPTDHLPHVTEKNGKKYIIHQYGAQPQILTQHKNQSGNQQNEAGSYPPGHLWFTWGVYLCAGKPPLADIILFHPPDLT